MVNHHFLDFPTFFWTLLGSFGTYPGVQNRPTGATFVKFGNLKIWVQGPWGPQGPWSKAPGAHIIFKHIFVIDFNIYFYLIELPIELPIVLPIGIAYYYERVLFRVGVPYGLCGLDRWRSQLQQVLLCFSRTSSWLS